MTDQTQSAVEAMARAIDEIADARGECPGDSARLNNPDECSQAALTAFLAHITASGWQIVPVVATEEMHNAARDWSYHKYGKPIGRDASEGCYATLLAAAPPFPGREG